jgi:hypothetical protein
MYGTHLLLNLQSVNDGGQLGEDLVGPLVIFELGGNQIRQVPQGLGGVQDLEIDQPLVKNTKSDRKKTYVLHHADSLLGLSNKLILSLLNLGASILGQVVQVATCGSLLVSLDGVERQTRVLNVAAGLARKRQVGVEGSIPARQKAGLDLSILGQTGLADLFKGQSVLFQRRRQGVLLGGCALRDQLRSGKRGTGDGMVKGLGLRLSRRRRSQGSLGFSGGRGVRQELHFLADGAAKVVERFADVGWVVVGFVGI